MRKTIVLLALLATLACTSVGVARISLLSELSQIHEAQPGDVVDGDLALHNPGDEPARVRIYQTDYLFAADGSNDYGEPGTIPRSNAPWIALGATEVTVPPGETLDVPYRVSVPDRSDLTGSYWSIVMVEEIEAVADDAPENGVSVRTVLRYGVQVVTEIGDSGARMLAFVDPVLAETEEGTTTLTVHAQNTGERMLRSQYYAELFDDQGALAFRVEGEPLRTYPGTSVRQHFDFGDLPEGTYTALVIADSGDEHVFGAQYTLHVGAE